MPSADKPGQEVTETKKEERKKKVGRALGHSWFLVLDWQWATLNTGRVATTDAAEGVTSVKMGMGDMCECGSGGASERVAVTNGNKIEKVA